VNAVEVDPRFEELLEYLARTRGFDFTSYKRASLMRRVRKRMQAVGTDDFVAYLDYLEVHPDEFAELFDTILINVTAFFRDPPVWEYLARDIVPQILAGKTATGRIRVWCAGCASGEEPYSVAMLLAEALGEEGLAERVKIYATDIDEGALERARQGVYTSSEVEAVPSELRERYFDDVNGSMAIRKTLRRAVIFGRHDLLRDAPISRIDLLFCRNVLMYFHAPAQETVLAQFHYALDPLGFLVLGRAETLLTRTNAFSPVDLKRRVFARAGLPPAEAPRFRLPFNNLGALPARPDGEVLRDTALEFSTLAEVIVDESGRVAAINREARYIFGLSREDIGQPLSELELSYRPVELRSLIEQAQAEGGRCTSTACRGG
jgi:two-component system CheB/CheR fusion protein